MDNNFIQEIAVLWDKIGDIERKLSDYTVSKTDEVKSIDGQTYDSNKVYKDGDTILYGNSFARCLHTNKGIEPTNKIYWELLTVSDIILELINRVLVLEQRGE